MDTNEITELTTSQQAINFLLDLARAEADKLKVAYNLYAARPEQCPPDVRKKAIRRDRILTAIKLTQEINNAH